MARVFVGTSGFSYKHWKGEFYPQDLLQTKWFEFYCQHFDTVELNVSFYRLPKKETFEKWRGIASISRNDPGSNASPDVKHDPGSRPRRCRSFVFAVKGSRYITHVKKLKNCREAVGRFFKATDGLRNVGEKREVGSESGSGDGGVVLWQLPPRFKANIERLNEFLKLLSKTWRHAFEFRSSTWLTVKVCDLLRQHSAAIVFQDFSDWPITEEITADFVYLRFQGRQSLYSSCYTEKELKEWVEKIRSWIKKDLDVYVYFNNDALGYAVENAKTLRKLASYA